MDVQSDASVEMTHRVCVTQFNCGSFLLVANRALPGRCLRSVPGDVSNCGDDPPEPWDVAATLPCH